MLIPHGTLILLVDGAIARLLRNHGRDSAPALTLLEERRLRNPPTHVLTADAPGRSFQSVAPERGALPTDDLHQRREDRFGREALDMVEARDAHAPIILIAPPHMLGDLRAHMAAAFDKRMIAAIDKDLTHLGSTDLLSWLSSYRP